MLTVMIIITWDNKKNIVTKTLKITHMTLPVTCIVVTNVIMICTVQCTQTQLFLPKDFTVIIKFLMENIIIPTIQ